MVIINNHKTALENAIEKVNEIRLEFFDREYKAYYTDDELIEKCDALSLVLHHLKYNSIPKSVIRNEIRKLKANVESTTNRSGYTIGECLMLIGFLERLLERVENEQN